MVRTPSSEESGMKKGSWSEEEDNKLRAYIQRYGHWNWRALPKYAGLSRCGKSCRLRWMNYLRPNVKHGNYSKEEEDIILKLHGELGNKWSAIAAHLPGRTDNEIKNYWHTRLKKRTKQNLISEVTPQYSTLAFQLEGNRPTSQCKGNQKGESVPENAFADSISHQILESTLISSKASSTDISTLSFTSTNLSSINRVTEDCTTTLESFSEPLESFWTEPFVSDSFYDQNYCSSTLSEGGYMESYMLYDYDETGLFYQSI